MKKRRKHFGGRSDGRRIKGIHPMDGVIPFIMPERNGASNIFKETLEIARTKSYIREKRLEGLEHFGMTHVILAAYVRTISQKPRLNRFISGQRIFAREDDISVNMDVKKSMTEDAAGTCIKVHFSPEDTAYDVYEKFSTVYREAMETDGDEDFEKTAAAINRMPRLLKKFVVWVLKLMDYFGLIPAFLLEVSPFHGSLFITSMGSLGVSPVCHHLYNFGNVPIFLAFGFPYSERKINSRGNVVMRQYIDLTAVIDERICDGYYYASAFKFMRKCIMEPEVLDQPPEKVVYDIE